jgi:hypothetical protein
VRQPRRGSGNRPDKECEECDADHAGHEIARDSVREFLNGRAAALRFRNHAHNLSQQGIGAYTIRSNDQRAVRVHRGSRHAVTSFLLDGNRLARDHRFVNAARAFEHHPVYRDLLAGPHSQTEANLDLFQRQIGLRAAFAHHSGRFGASPRRARMAAPVWLRALNSRTCPRSTRVVIAAAASKYTATPPVSSRKDAGKILGNSAAIRLYPYATPTPSPIKVNMFRLRFTSDCHARTKKGQPPHRTTGVARMSSNQVQNRAGAKPEKQAAGHSRDEHRQRQAKTGPESPRHIAKLRIVLLLRRHRPRFESHAADWAVSRRIAHNLRMHGANVLRPSRWRGGRNRLQSHSALRALPPSRLAHFGMHRAGIFHFLSVFCPGTLPPSFA